MPVTVSKEIEEAAQDIVSVVNVGNRTIRERYNGRPYVFPGKDNPDYPNGSVMHIPAGRAWLWFGNPAERDNPKDWNNACRMLENRVGRDHWEYLQSGDFYVREWAEAYGKGKDFYRGALPDESEIEVTATPLDEDFVAGGLSLEDALRLAEADSQPVTADDLLNQRVRTKGVAKPANVKGPDLNDAADIAVAKAAGMAELASGKHR